MHEHKQPRPPRELSGYLDAMARVMFQTGISWRVVDAKWPGIQEAFHGFDPNRVAKLRTKDLDKLMTDTRVIRNRKKLEAIAGNAGRMVELDKEFAYMGDTGTWYFLWMVGRKVPDHGEM